MARSFGKLLCDTWSNPDFLALSNDAKVLYLAFTSQSDITPAGVVPLTERRWTKWLGTDVEGVSKALDELAEGRFVVVDDDTAEVWIRSFIKHDQRLMNSKLAHSVHRATDLIRSKTIKSAASVEISRFNEETPGGRDNEGPSPDDGRPFTENAKGDDGSRGLGSSSSAGNLEPRTQTPEPRTVEPETPIAQETAIDGDDDRGGDSQEVTAAQLAEWAGRIYAETELAKGQDVKPDKLGPWKAKQLLEADEHNLERIAEWANNYRSWSGLNLPRTTLAAAALGEKRGLAQFPERPPSTTEQVERISPEQRAKALRDNGAPERLLKVVGET